MGKGTIELNVGPYATLFELEIAFRSAVERLVRAAAKLAGAAGYGVQPLSPPNATCSRQNSATTPSPIYGRGLDLVTSVTARTRPTRHQAPTQGRQHAQFGS